MYQSVKKRELRKMLSNYGLTIYQATNEMNNSMTVSRQNQFQKCIVSFGCMQQQACKRHYVY